MKKNEIGTYGDLEFQSFVVTLFHVALTGAC